MHLSNLNEVFTFDSFVQCIKQYTSKNEEIRIFAYITNLERTKLFDFMNRFGFSIRQLGDIIELKLTSGEKNENDSIFYCHIKENLVLCFTSYSFEDGEKTIDKFVSQHNGIYPLWIQPDTFDWISRSILNKDPNSMILEFHATRRHMDASSRREKVLREDYPRYFKYLGDDGKYTFEEISKIYGVSATHFQFLIPDLCRFRITNMGRFALINGNIDFLFEVINQVLSKVLEMKSVIDRARTEFIPVNMGRREINLPKITPLNIIFGREIDFFQIEQFLNYITFEDSNFEMLDMSLLSGSVHLSGTLVDRNKNTEFSITGSTNKMTLSPREDTTFDSLLNFYRLVIERLDTDARCQVREISNVQR